jgi:hypothetical protein
MRRQIAIAGAAGSSGVFVSTLNPFGVDILIHSAILRITTQSTGAATVDIGVAADATTSNDGLIDGLSVAAAGVFNTAQNGGTNGKNGAVWGAAQYLNVAEASGNVADLVAALHLEYSLLG